ncbi:MAG: type II secretion system F family protein [Planctomycetota bacterium]
MPVYTFKETDLSGKVKKRSSFAPSEFALEREIESEGRTLVKILEVRQGSQVSNPGMKIKKTDLIEMAFHLSIMSASGIPLLTGLEDFCEQRATPRLKRVLNDIIREVNSGRLFSEALEKHPKAFDPVFVSLIKAGETSGSLDIVMERYYKDAEWQMQTKQRLIQALVYPTMLIGALTGLVVLLLTFLLPKVMNLFPVGMKLPLPTRILVMTSQWVQSNWIALLGLVIMIPVAVHVARFFSKGRFYSDMGLMKLPVIGGIVRDVAVARFIATFRTLLGSGVTVIKALEVAVQASGNQVIIERVSRSIVEITNGALLSQAFEPIKEFSSLIQNLIRMSERTGQTMAALDRITDYFDTTIPRAVKRMISIMEPAITIAAGMLVGFVLVGTLLPIFDLYSVL